MNRLVIIGNGFDMAHGLKTSYMDFINWYWNQRVNTFVGNFRRQHNHDVGRHSLQIANQGQRRHNLMMLLAIE